MLSKGFGILGIFVLIQVIVFSFLTDLKPIAIGGAIIVLISSFVMAVLWRKEPSSMEKHVPKEKEGSKSESIHEKNGTAMLVAAVFLGLRVMYYNLVNHYGTTDFQEICIFFMGIFSLVGGIVLKLRYRKLIMEQEKTENMDSIDNNDVAQ